MTNNDNQNICQKCGFDERTDFIKYRTLCSVSAMDYVDYQKRKNQKKAQSSVVSAPITQPNEMPSVKTSSTGSEQIQNVPESKLKEIQMAFKEAADKSILQCRTASIGRVEKELKKQGFKIAGDTSYIKDPKDHLYHDTMLGYIQGKYTNKEEIYYVSYSASRNGILAPWKTKCFRFYSGCSHSTGAWDVPDAFNRVTPLPFGIRMGDGRDTVQKKLGLMENMELWEVGNFISSSSIHIKFEKECYYLRFDTSTKRLVYYDVEFTN
jgi:hypothetical protein